MSSTYTGNEIKLSDALTGGNVPVEQLRSLAHRVQFTVAFTLQIVNLKLQTGIALTARAVTIEEILLQRRKRTPVVAACRSMKSCNDARLDARHRHIEVSSMLDETSRGHG